MSLRNSCDETAVRYLLGKLPEAERDDFEDRYFSDDALHEQLQAIEEELIDSYVRGRLDPADRAAFESRFLQSPERRQRIEFARALAAVPARPAQVSLLSRLFPVSLGMRLALAGAAAAAAVVLMMNLPPQASPQRASVNPNSPPPANVAPQKGNVPATPILAFALVPGLRSEGGVNRISIPPGTDRVRLNLTLDADADFPQYTAVVASAEGQEVWREGDLRRSGSTVTTTVPARLLVAGNYAVKLTGFDGKTVETVAGYSLAVQEK